MSQILVIEDNDRSFSQGNLISLANPVARAICHFDLERNSFTDGHLHLVSCHTRIIMPDRPHAASALNARTFELSDCRPRRKVERDWHIRIDATRRAGRRGGSSAPAYVRPAQASSGLVKSLMILFASRSLISRCLGTGCDRPVFGLW